MPTESQASKEVLNESKDSEFKLDIVGKRMKEDCESSSCEIEELPTNKRILRTRMRVAENMINADSNSESEEDKEPQRALSIQVMNPMVESIHSRRYLSGRCQYFVRYQGQSYARCKWVNQDEILRNDPGFKSKLKRFEAIFQQQNADGDGVIGYQKDAFNVDRILNSSELFTIVHPKKTLEMRLSWCQNLLRVVRILINYRYNGFNCGVFGLGLLDLCDNYKDIADPRDFVVVINCLYLGQYKVVDQFWQDLNKVFLSMEQLQTHLDEKSDVGYLRIALESFACLLYDEWFKINQLEQKFVQQLQQDSPFCTLLGDTRRRSKDLFCTLENIDEQAKRINLFYKDYEEAFKMVDDISQTDHNDVKDKIQQLLDLSSQYINIVGKKDYINISEDYSNNNTKEDSVLIQKSGDISTPLNTSFNATKTNNLKTTLENTEIQNFNINSNSLSDDCLSPKGEQMLIEGQHIETPYKQEDIQKQEEEEISQLSIIRSGSPNAKQQQKISEGEMKKNMIKKLEEELSILTIVIKEKIEYYVDVCERIHFMVQNPQNFIQLQKYNYNETLFNHVRSSAKHQSQLQQMSKEGVKLSQKTETFYFVKWLNQSYVDATWERESDLHNCQDNLMDFKRFQKALDRESRSHYFIRNAQYQKLASYINNPKNYAQIRWGQYNEERRKLFYTGQQRARTHYNLKNQPVFKGERLLRPYQIEGLNFMVDAWHSRKNIILADEMGLGKTIQAVSFIHYLVTMQGLVGPYLIIAPLSTLPHWKRTFDEWTNMNTILYYDQKGKIGRLGCQKHDMYRNEIMYHGKVTTDTAIAKFHVMITSYEVYAQDYEPLLRTLPFQHIIIDEAHRLKNKTSRILQLLRRAVCNRVFLLTGTPIQNNVGELWTLLNFIEPTAFSSQDDFISQYGSLSNAESVQQLRKVIDPFLLRRMKEDVEHSIPPLTENIIDVELTQTQKIVYKTLYEKNKGTLQRGAGLNYVTLMNNLEMQLRKCCNHPFLIKEIKENLTQDCDTQAQYIESVVSSSGKMIFLDKALQKFERERKKVLIFSQFTEMLSIIEEYLVYKGVVWYRIDGSTRGRDRQVLIDLFNKKEDSFKVFILSTKAGGLGINLTSATTVLIYDSDWNPQNDVQAIARAHRIGQTEEVSVFRLVSINTYESEMFERASKKLGLDRAILLSSQHDANANQGQTLEQQQINTKLQTKEIDALLRKGMIGLLQLDQKEDYGYQFLQDVDEIIKNSRKASYSVVTKAYNIQKTRFAGNQEDVNINIDDPDFWKNVFLEQKSAAELLEREYQKVFFTDRRGNPDEQRKLFIRISKEVYQYLEDKVKNESYSADIERKFEDLLTALANNEDLHEYLVEFAEQLCKDFAKKSRRIKPIEEKAITAKFKHLIQPKKHKVSNRRREDKEGNDQEGGEQRHQQSIKQSAFCCYCGQAENVIECRSHCNQKFHFKCLQESVRIYLGMKDGRELPKDQDITSQLYVDSACYFCASGTISCFICKRWEDKTADDFTLLQCSYCFCHYHKDCLEESVKKKKSQFMVDESKMRCPRHFCQKCNNSSNSLIKCVKCLKSYHKKCIDKNAEIISQGFFFCKHHRKEDINEQTKQPLLPNESQQVHVVNEKKLKIKTSSEVYGRLEIVKPVDYDYKNSKETWCSYCGARYSEEFTTTDDKNYTFCKRHTSDYQKNKLQLENVQLPILEPINLNANTEKYYLCKKYPLQQTDKN